MPTATLFHVLKSMVPTSGGGVLPLTGVARLLGPSLTPWSRVAEYLTTSTLTPASATTLTVDQISGGLIIFTPTASMTATLPSAAAIAAAHPRLRVNHAINCIVKNTAAATFTVTIAAGAGGTMAPTDTWVLQPGAAGTCTTVEFLLIMTAIGTTPTYTCRSIGLSVS